MVITNPILNSFLTEKGIKDQFIINIDKADWEEKKEINKIDSLECINSFDWAKTPEGDKFWDALYYLYPIYYRQYKKEHSN